VTLYHHFRRSCHHQAIMVLLPQFPLPLPPHQPPSGYRWEERDISAVSTTTAFNTGINGRDKFLGQKRCIICGLSTGRVLQHGHIIAQAEPETVSRTCAWALLRLMQDSGPSSEIVVGFPQKPKTIPNTNRAMAYLCVATIISCSMDILSLFASFPM
jgi:hypothetical protein